MGTGSLTTETDGDTANAADVNQYKNALLENLVPRNTAGVATDLAGSLGTSALRWLNAYISKLIIGTVASGLSIEEDTGEIIFKVSDTEVARIGANGIDSSSLTNAKAISSAGSLAVSGGTWTDITNHSVSVTTRGGLVVATLVPDIQTGSGTSKIQGGSAVSPDIRLLRDATQVGALRMSAADQQSPGEIVFCDNPAAGSYTYKIQARTSSGNLAFDDTRLLVYEIL